VEFNTEFLQFSSTGPLFIGWGLKWAPDLIKLGAVRTVVMGHPDKQLCDQNSEIFAENLSCLRVASRRWGTVVQTVTRPMQVISLLRLHASGPWGWPSERLTFYTQFPYLLYARPENGRLASGRLSLNCKLALRSMLVFLPHSVFRQNHLFVKML
jgi:hypothetical protein